MSKLYPIYSRRVNLAKRHPVDKSELVAAYARTLAGGTHAIIVCPPVNPTFDSIFAADTARHNPRNHRRGQR